MNMHANCRSIVIGNGLIANSLKNQVEEVKNTIFFASGVSNSSETRKTEFEREREILKSNINKERLFIYFSTCSVYDGELRNTEYVKHKHEMEKLVTNSQNYLICRLPQVVGNTANKNTLTNFLFEKIRTNIHFNVWKNAKRNIIDVNDVADILIYIIKNKVVINQTINICAPYSITLTALVNVFEKILARKANYSLVDAGSAYQIDSSLSSEIATKVGIQFEANYMESVIRCYYENRLKD